MDLPMGIVFGLLAMLGYGLSGAIAKVPIGKVGSIKTIFFRNIFTSIILLITVLLYIRETVFSPFYILIAFVISFVAYIPFVTYFKAIKTGKVGIVVPVANSSVVFTVLFSILFFGESLSPMQMFSIVLIVAGIVLISLDFKDLKNSGLFSFSSGIPYALVTSFLWGVAYFLLKIPVDVIGPMLTSFILEFTTFVFSAVSLKFSHISFSLPDRRCMGYIFLVALTGCLGTLFYNLGIGSYGVSIVAALTFSNPLVSAIYARFAYGERLGGAQYIAIALIMLGIVTVSYY